MATNQQSPSQRRTSKGIVSSNPLASQKSRSIDKQNTPTLRPLSKNYLSRSQDNIASTLRRQAVTFQLTTKPKIQTVPVLKPRGIYGSSVNLSPTYEESRQSYRLTTNRMVTPRKPLPKMNSISGPSPRKPPGFNAVDGKSAIPIRKSSSIQHLAGAGRSERAESCSPAIPSLRRTSSQQNLNTSDNKQPVRATKSSSQALAYNADLLASFEKEKKHLENRISELTQITEKRKTEIEMYKFEVKNLREQIPSQDVKDLISKLKKENKKLRKQLESVGVNDDPDSTLADSRGSEGGVPTLSEESDRTVISCRSDDCSDNGATGDITGSGDDCWRSVPDTKADIEGSILTVSNSQSLGDLTNATPDHPSTLDTSVWDKQSLRSGGVKSDLTNTGDVSVAYLHDRITQMEERNYSTTEELQATLLELQDLQRSVDELTDQNEGLAFKNCRLLEALCDQTLKLENCRTQIEHLKALLITDDSYTNRSEHERQLVELLKIAHEEREELVLQQTELCNAYQSADSEGRQMQDVISSLKEKQKLLEERNEIVVTDKKALEKQLTDMREQHASEQIECQRYMTLLDNEKSKVRELEKFRDASNKTELEELLDNARQEKSRIESSLANTKEQLARSHQENDRLCKQVSTLEEELQASSSSAKTTVSDLEVALQEVTTEKTEMKQEMDALRDHIDQLEQDCDRYLDDKKSYTSTINKLQAEVKAAQQKYLDLEKDVDEHKVRHSQEKFEWDQFQADLQTAVVIANEIRTEAQMDVERLSDELHQSQEHSSRLQEDLTRVTNELELLRAQQKKTTAPTITTTAASPLTNSEIRGRVLNSVDRELNSLRQGRSVGGGVGDKRTGSQPLSVKSLIRSIEGQVKGSSLSSSGSSSRRSSVDSLSTVIKQSATANVNVANSPSTNDQQPANTPKRPPANQRIDRVHSAPPEPSNQQQPQLKSALKKSPANEERDKRPASDSLLSAKSPSQSQAKSPGATPVVHTSPITTILTLDNNYNEHGANEKRDPLVALVKQRGGSKRNALLKWCQDKTSTYEGIDITNFSSSWNDGLAFCALIHNYLPEKIPYRDLKSEDKRKNFNLAFKAAESIGIPTSLDINEMVAIERPDWQKVMSYVTAIFKHFEADNVITGTGMSVPDRLMDLIVRTKVIFSGSVFVTDLRPSIEYNDFVTELQNICKIEKNQRFTAKWIDEEGDPCTISSQIELNEAMRLYDVNKEAELILHVFRGVPEQPGMLCPGEDRNMYRKGARRWRKLYHVNGHYFTPKRFSKRAFCTLCTDRIWGLGRQGMKCIECKLMVHKKCHKLISVTCGGKASSALQPFSRAAPASQSLPIIDPNVAQLPNSSGAAVPTTPTADGLPSYDEATADNAQQVPRGPDGSLLMHDESSLQPNVASAHSIGIDDFSLLRVIGRGSYAKVLLVEQKRTARVYAMKIIKKEVVNDDEDIDWVQTEKHVFETASNHPFLVGLHSCFQTPSRLFFVIEFVSGGDMMYHMQRQRKLPEDHARFYAAEISLALNFLHEKGIIYRDLKLDNVLLDSDGHVKLTDYGMCKEGIKPGDLTATFCGTPNYIAPEMLRGDKYGFSVDWWALGVLMYEMMAGRSPFELVGNAENPDQNTEDYLFQLILEKTIRIPRSLSVKAASILKAFLNKDPLERLGCHPQTGFIELQSHIFFRSIDWDLLEQKQIVPPYKPPLRSDRDIEHFDPLFTNETVQFTPDDPKVIGKIDQTEFEGFEYVNPLLMSIEDSV